MKRRDFLKAAGGGALVAATASGTAEARPNKEPPANAVGMLYDSTLCVGCQACMSECKRINGMPPEQTLVDDMWDSPADLSGETLNIIKLYRDGDGSVKDRETDGFAFVKRHCQHCIYAGCVSVCPVSAMRKDEKTGIVTHHEDVCIGCRYCVYACPYNVPKYEFSKVDGQIRKCQFCNQTDVSRIDNGQLPGCVESCPTGASLFGTYQDLKAEAEKRVALKPGEAYVYPRGMLNPGSGGYTQPGLPPHEKPAPAYQPEVFGDADDSGGTQVLHIAGVPFQKLGLPDLPERSFAARSETVQHTIYGGAVLPLAALAGLAYAARRSTVGKEDGEGSKGGEQS
jgi:Fe-S-cluster-containing dehydrogenase component